jgi:hypothetical protein
VILTGEASLDIARVVISDTRGDQVTATTGGRELNLGTGFYAARLPAGSGTGTITVRGYDTRGTIVATSTWFPMSQRENPTFDAIKGT